MKYRYVDKINATVAILQSRSALHGEPQSLLRLGISEFVAVETTKQRSSAPLARGCGGGRKGVAEREASHVVVFHEHRHVPVSGEAIVP